MDARELTKLMAEVTDRLIMLEREVNYLSTEYDKQRRRIKDMEIDIKMLQNRRDK